MLPIELNQMIFSFIETPSLTQMLQDVYQDFKTRVENDDDYFVGTYHISLWNRAGKSYFNDSRNGWWCGLQMTFMTISSDALEGGVMIKVIAKFKKGMAWMEMTYMTQLFSKDEYDAFTLSDWAPRGMDLPSHDHILAIPDELNFQVNAIRQDLDVRDTDLPRVFPPLHARTMALILEKEKVADA